MTRSKTSGSSTAATTFIEGNDDLSTRSIAALTAIPDMGAQIQAGLGVHPDDVPVSEVTLVTILIDDSGSIRSASNAQAVRDGHNGIVDALLATKQADNILLFTGFLNGMVPLNPYSPLSGATKLDTNNYDPAGGTPLFDMTAITLATVLAKTKQFEDAGVIVRTVTAIITDGADTGSTIQRDPRGIKAIVADMLKTEKHIVCGVGVFDGYTDFKSVFGSMGIEDKWILTPTNDPKEIRKAFAMVSRSAVRASQGAAGHSQAAAGGFGA
jgi:hypothetical protein